MATTALKRRLRFPEGLKVKKINTGSNTLHIKKDSLLDWYRLTESARHVLNSIITQCGRLQLEEMEKENPDLDKLNKLHELSGRAVEISRDPRNFENKQLMLEIIDTFGNIEIG